MKLAYIQKWTSYFY